MLRIAAIAVLAILLTTHDMAEAEALCDRVVLIDRGRVLAVETPRTLSRWVTEYERVEFESARPELAERVRALPGVASVWESASGRYRVELAQEAAARLVLQFLVDNDVTSLRTARPTLEEVYVRLIGERGDAGVGAGR